jgi:hypothetical protein
MPSSVFERLIGIERSPIKANNDRDVSVNVGKTIDVSDVVSGIGPARSYGQLEITGILDSPIRIEGKSAIEVLGTSSIRSTAKASTGSALAAAIYGGARSGPGGFDTGGFSGGIITQGVPPGDLPPGVTPGKIRIDQDGTINIDVTQEAVSIAQTRSGRSAAFSTGDGFFGLYNTDVKFGTTVGPTGPDTTLSTLASRAASIVVADAESISPEGDDGLLPNAIAVAGTKFPIPTPGEEGIEFVGRTQLVGIGNVNRQGEIYFTSDAELSGIGEGELASRARSVSGGALSRSAAYVAAGIFDDRRLVETVTEEGTTESTGSEESQTLDIFIGENGTVEGLGTLTTSSEAYAANGLADATVDVENTVGIGDKQVYSGRGNGSSSLFIGRDGAINAQADIRNTAIAESITAAGPGDVRAKIDNDYVVGLALDKVNVGQSASLNAGALSVQEAKASSVNSKVDPFASVAEDDEIYGIRNTDIKIGKDLVDPLTAKATLIGSAVADSVNAGDDVDNGTIAQAGVGSRVGALTSPTKSTLTVGGNGNIIASARTELGARATTINGLADAQVGDEDPIPDGTFRTTLDGIENYDIELSGVGNISGNAVSLLDAVADSFNGEADASVGQRARGIATTKITLGNGNVMGEAFQQGNATATGGTLAESDVDLQSYGVNQQTETIKIKDSGNVAGFGTAIGNSIAAIADGGTGVNAYADFDAAGIKLDAPRGVDPNIDITELGSVVGEAEAGGRPSIVSAFAVDAPVKADGDFRAVGIGGTNTVDFESSLVKAGARGGDITGLAESAAEVSAVTSTGPADSVIGGPLGGPAMISGVANTDLVGGLLGINLVSGTGKAVYTNTALSTDGGVTAASDTDVFGFMGGRFDPIAERFVPSGNNTILLAGDVLANASLKSDVFSGTVIGPASSTESGQILGISGYALHLLGPGTVTANVTASTTTASETVLGGPLANYI